MNPCALCGGKARGSDARTIVSAAPVRCSGPAPLVRVVAAARGLRRAVHGLSSPADHETAEHTRTRDRRFECERTRPTGLPAVIGPARGRGGLKRAIAGGRRGRAQSGRSIAEAPSAWKQRGLSERGRSAMYREPASASEREEQWATERARSRGRGEGRAAGSDTAQTTDIAAPSLLH